MIFCTCQHSFVHFSANQQRHVVVIRKICFVGIRRQSNALPADQLMLGFSTSRKRGLCLVGLEPRTSCIASRIPFQPTYTVHVTLDGILSF
jgi:hypothetical protein